MRSRGIADIESLLAAVFRERSDFAAKNAPLLSRSILRLRELQQKRLGTLAGVANATGHKARIKALLADTDVLQSLEKAQRVLRNIFTHGKRERRSHDFATRRVLAILKDVEEGIDGIASYAAMPYRHGSDGSVASRNLDAALSWARGSERSRLLQEGSFGRRQQNSFEERKTALKSRLSALKTSSLIGKIFHYLGSIVMPLASLVTAMAIPALGIASAVIRTLLSGLIGNAFNAAFQALTGIAQRASTIRFNAADSALQNAEFRSRNLSRLIAADESVRERDDAIQAHLIQSLEQALEKRRRNS